MNASPRFVASLFFLCLLPSFLHAVSPDIIKSPNDSRDYHSLRLGNGLQVMLISDPEGDKAAAAMDVAVGSAHDPEAYQGLAHFLEHMLFLGTKRFPEPDAYQRFISEHGGSHNAYTSLEHTNYFFDVAPDHLEAALQRFAEQFTSPLFNPEYVKREVNAVHSEFTSKLKDDGRRLYSVLKELINPEHPYSKFSVGNLETLNASDEEALREAMLDFYEAHYAASNMRLVVLGKEPLSQLERWVRQYFSAIPQFDTSPSIHQRPLFLPETLPLKVEVQSIYDKPSMLLAFPIPSAFKHQTSKPVSYLANLIGHEGEGSLLASLKQRGLVDSLSAGSQFDTKLEEIFTISMSLTARGMAEQESILLEVFAYIKRLQSEGIKRLYFDEQATMLDVSFRYQEKSEAIHLVSGLANALQDYSPQEVLYKGYELSDFQPDLYRQYLKLLIPENMLVVIQNKEAEGDKLSKWYEAPYRIQKLNPELISNLSQTPPSPMHSMPDANPFLPEQLTLVRDSNQSKPEKLLNKTGLTVWHQTFLEFNTPKSNLFVSVRSPEAMASAENQNLSELMVGMFRDALNTFSYPAYLAGLNYELYNHLRGITIKISGYSDKQSVLLNRLLSTMQFGTLNPSRFELIKDRLQRKLQNAAQAKPYERTFAKLQNHLLNPSWDEMQRLSALEDTSFDDLLEFRQAFFEEIDIVLLSAGNVTRANSLNLSAQVESLLLKGAKPTNVARAKVAKRHEEKAAIINFEVDHSDSALALYLQGASRNFKDQVILQMLAQVSGSDFYNEMRTEKQLGYIVFASYMPLLEVPGMVFIIQSPTSKPLELLSHTDDFVNRIPELIDELDDETFTRHKAALQTKLEQKYKNLYQLSNYHWQEIDRLNENFDTRERLIEALRVLNKGQLSSEILALNIKEPKNRLAVLAGQSKPDETPAGWMIIEPRNILDQKFFIDGID